MYDDLWSPVAFAGVDDVGVAWDVAANLSPLLSPLHHSSGDSPSFGSAGLDIARLNSTPLVSDMSTSEGSASSSVGSDAGEGEAPAAANRATTPPRSRFTKKPAPPPGLGIEASPMKIECSSERREEFTRGSRLSAFASLDGFAKIR